MTDFNFTTGHTGEGGCCKKYVVLCCLCGGLSAAVGSLFLAVHAVLSAHTASLALFETVPSYIPGIMVRGKHQRVHPTISPPPSPIFVSKTKRKFKSRFMRVQFPVNPNGSVHDVTRKTETQIRAFGKSINYSNPPFLFLLKADPPIFPFQMKVCGSVGVVCALVCVLVTVTTTVIHMSRLQGLRKCVYTVKAR